jgi:hypothetical protein
LQHLGVNKTPLPLHLHLQLGGMVEHYNQNGQGAPKEGHRTKDIEMQDYASSSLLTGHPLTTLLWA